MSRRRFSAMRTAGRLARPAHNDDAHMQVRNRGHVAKLPEPWGGQHTVSERMSGHFQRANLTPCNALS